MTAQHPASARTRRFRQATAVALGVPLMLAASSLVPGAYAAPGADDGASTFQQATDFDGGSYIVMLKDQPLAAYDGETAGYPATQPAKGEKLDVDSKAAQDYEAYLEGKQQEVAAAEGIDPDASFTTAINAFTADLSADQAAELAKNPAIYALAPNEQFSPDYSSTEFLGLPGEDGVWATQLGGAANAGKGTVVGVIDTGYWPENAFLAGEPVQPLVGSPVVGEPYLTAEGKIAMLKADGGTFLGECQTGEDFDGSACNSKVLSARYFADDFLRFVPPANRAPEERISPLDINSHGTHTASTAAGNSEVPVVVDGRSFGTGSGVAPAAAVSVYKICWEDTNPNTGGCFSSASIAAIEQAIRDGVDVLNYSISGNNNSTTDPVALAFLSAASAGIFVSASAGNSGPTASTVNHSSPWLTTVAASTFSHELQGTVELSDGTKYRGASIMNRELPQTALILSRQAALAGTDPARAALCYPGSLDPAKVAGKIVVCDRGVIARVDKSAAVLQANGAGMVLVNVVPGSLDLDLHSVPTVHIDGTEIKDKVAANPALTAALVDEDTTGLLTLPTPQIAAFSSRGPSLASNSDLLKPDLAAPGVNVLAGVSPVSTGENFGFSSGTSMAAPQVAGLGALILAKNPTWSPAAAKSALMTTAGNLVTADGSVDPDVFATGAGHANAAAMLSPGLVYDANATHWNGYLQSLGAPLGLKKKQVVEARNVNVPSIALGSLTGKVTVTRTVTATAPGSYTASVALPGIQAKVSPAKLSFKKAGESQSFRVTFENQSAALDEYSLGRLTWTERRGGTVSSPIAVQPVTAVVPATVDFSSAAGTGSGSFSVVSGTDAPIDLAVKGLAKANSRSIELVPGGAPSTRSNASNDVSEVVVPEGSSLARFAINADDQADDFDLYLITPDGRVLQAATAAASEALVLNNPLAGRYLVIANLYSTADGGPATASVEVTVLAGDEGNMSVSPDPLVLANGEDGEVNVAWTGLEPGSYVGRVEFGTGPATAVSVTIGADGTATTAPAATVVDGGAQLSGSGTPAGS